MGLCSGSGLNFKCTALISAQVTKGWPGFSVGPLLLEARAPSDLSKPEQLTVEMGRLTLMLQFSQWVLCLENFYKNLNSKRMH